MYESAVGVGAELFLHGKFAQNRVKKFTVRSFTATKLLLGTMAAVFEAVLWVLELTH